MSITYEKGMPYRNGSPNQTAFRFSDEVAEIVLTEKGNSFAEKFTNICLDYKKTIKQKKNEIKELDKEINKRKKEYHSLLKEIDNCNIILMDLNNIQNSLKRISKNKLMNNK